MDANAPASAPVSGFVAPAMKAPEPPPVSARGPVAWVRAHLLGSPLQILLTLFGLWVVWLAVPPLIRFFLIDAVYTGDNRNACLPDVVGRPVGACWPFIAAKWNQIVYGFYPEAERWRVNLVYALAVILLVPLLLQKVPYKRLNALLFFGVFPVVAFVLLTGGHLSLNTFILSWVGLGGVFTAIGKAVGLPSGFWPDYVVSALLVSAIVGAVAPLLAGSRRSAFRATLVVFAVLGLVLAAVNINFGLEWVETRQWGGMMVTLVIAVTGIIASLPLGILLALGRRSKMPLMHIASTLFIEFWRGVPLVTVLFFATYMLPLFLPGRFTIDGLLRALVGVALFASAYMAEVVRGGLQAIPKGQYEGAMALGLPGTLMMRLVVLPQALKLVIPGIVNTFIALFKDTTLVLIVSIFDLLGVLRAAFTDPSWATPTTLYTGFGFAGLFYFIFCFGMSRYSLALEKRLDRNHRH
ncbi:amino acid ABC transporter membrane protein 2 (PAAT family) [Azorhizobium sp. AG788]|uniref:amino acid ABC transporter permease n=1 Tax=Azorhizobium sp. AG788 TaxID=2183897 RepID=UPI0010DEF78F|nr:amino acid ABC transporter permease [Azorhizobium sp. AG788]TDT94598.1 amino acid ABC transporter membrane protein 2 (PAAT family) [Azorhizobium sp. AG788]